MGNDVWIDEVWEVGKTRGSERCRPQWKCSHRFLFSPASHAQVVDGTFNLPSRSAHDTFLLCVRGAVHVRGSHTVPSFVRRSRVARGVYMFIKLEGSLWVVEQRAPLPRKSNDTVRDRWGDEVERKWKRARWHTMCRRRVLRGWRESERGCFSTTSCSRHPQTPLDPNGTEPTGERGRKREEEGGRGWKGKAEWANARAIKVLNSLLPSASCSSLQHSTSSTSIHNAVRGRNEERPRTRKKSCYGLTHRHNDREGESDDACWWNLIYGRPAGIDARYVWRRCWWRLESIDFLMFVDVSFFCLTFYIPV